jgi:hypothetical protein
MVEAAHSGHEKIVRLCYDEWGACTDAVEHAMAQAAYRGHETIVRLCHDEWGAADVKWAMAEAAEGGTRPSSSCVKSGMISL